MLYETLTGELPVGRFPAPSEKVDIDVRLDHVVLRTLENEPRLRYQHARDLQTAVESLSTPAAASSGIVEPHPGDRPTTHTRPRESDADYEYRSAKKIFGLPLVHIAHSRDPTGARIRVAFGILALGDVAVGLVAVGGFAFGGIAISGISVGLVGIGGIAAGLLVAIGGVATGGYALGGLAFGVVARGQLAFALWDPAVERASQIGFAVWFVLTVLITGAVTVFLRTYLDNAGASQPRRH